MHAKTSTRRLRFPIGLGLTLALLTTGGAVALAPVSTRSLQPRPRPARSYAEALARFDALHHRDGSQVNPVCFSRLLTHGRQTERAVVLFHGVTNCPQQYAVLGQMLFKRGANVLIPRMPKNGYADIETDALHHLTAEQLCDYGDTSIDIAQGLGREVIIAGLSAGGVVAAWAAQHRADVARALVIAPAFGLGFAPAALNPLVRNLFLRLPNIQRHRDDTRIEPPHNYAQQSTRGLGQILRLGVAVFRAARRAPPAAHSVLLVSNASDHIIRNDATDRLGALWRAHGYPVEAYTFAEGLHLAHDTIDPLQQDQHIDTVYPILMDLLERSVSDA